MANVGTAPAGKTLIGQGDTTSSKFADIGTDSGLTEHGVLLAQGTNAFTATAEGVDGSLLIGATGADPAMALPTSINDTVTFHPTANGLGFEDRRWLTAFVVDPSASVGERGTYQTIQAATDAASSGDIIIIRPGTYTENLTPKSNVNYISLDAGYLRGNTKIIGKITADNLVECVFKGITFQTNSDYIFSDQGTQSGTIVFENCDFIYTDFAGWLCTNTNRTIVNYCCNNSIQGNNLKIYELAIGVYACRFCFWEGLSATPTGSTISAGQFAAQHCNGIMPFTSSGTAFFSFNHTSWGRVDTDMITHNGTGTHSTFTHTQVSSGTQPAITVGAGATIVVHDLTIFSSNANAIGGAGTMQGAEINFNSGNGGITISNWTAGISRNRAMQFTTGATINEFSTDGTLAGDSDTAVPTEKAVKTYVDANAGGGAWELISSATASASATIDFTGLSATYFMYKVVISGLIPANDGVRFRMQTSTNNGSSYDSGASDYMWGWLNMQMSPTGPGSGGDNADSKIDVTGAIGTAANELADGIIYLFNPSAAQYFFSTWTMVITDASGARFTFWGSGARLSAADVDAIRFIMETGNIEAGEFKLYGLVAS